MTEATLFSGVNHASDADNMSDLEKKHVPVITAPDSVRAGEPFNVTVEVGKHLAHPNSHDHYINFLHLYAGDLFLARLDLIPARSNPEMTVNVQLDQDLGPLRAFEFCNIHGTWESRKPIAVT